MYYFSYMLSKEMIIWLFKKWCCNNAMDATGDATNFEEGGDYYDDEL